MALTAQTSADGANVTISVIGRFDFNIHHEFRQAYEHAGDSIKKYVIDMKGTEYMDSSALGMLLLLRDHTGGEASNISIINSSKDIKKILEIANFNKLFNID